MLFRSLNFDQATILRDAAVPTTAANLTLPPPQGLARNGSVVRIDTSAQPAVLNVTSPDPNGVYAPGDEIEFVVTFSEMVAVTGTPFINIETGKVDRIASYISGSGTDRLRFRYFVVAGDVSYDLDYVDAHSLERGADESGTLGTILMMSTNPTVAADLDLALVGASGSISASQAIVVDGTTPYIIALALLADSSRSYTLGEDRKSVV